MAHNVSKTILKPYKFTHNQCDKIIGALYFPIVVLPNVYTTVFYNRHIFVLRKRKSIYIQTIVR